MDFCCLLSELLPQRGQTGCSKHWNWTRGSRNRSLLRTFDAKSNKKQQPGPRVTMFCFRKHSKRLCFDVFWRTDQTAQPNVEKKLKQTPIVTFMVVHCARPPAQDASKEISIHLLVSPWNITSVSNFALKTRLKLVVKWQVNLLNPNRGWTRSSLRFARRFGSFG